MVFNKKKNILYIFNYNNIILLLLVSVILIMLILEINKIYEGNTNNCGEVTVATAHSTNNSQLDSSFISNQQSPSYNLSENKTNLNCINSTLENVQSQT
tara:strand:- start:110 stop:406 length:297 start_codon:yes stop_codon:yes gene_type:complete